MKRTLRHVLSGSFTLLFAVVLQQAVAGCAVDHCAIAVCGTGTGGSGTGGHAGTGGTGGGAACHLDPPGTSFTFHVHNGGTKMLRLAYGCGGDLPIVLDAPQGKLSIGPGAVYPLCEFTCDAVYSGMAGMGCSDCGPGYGADLGPGKTADIKWDRRVYVAQTSEPKCSGGVAQKCALGEAVAAVAAQKGTVAACTDMGPSAGTCSISIPVGFTVDTTKTEATIEVP